MPMGCRTQLPCTPGHEPPPTPPSPRVPTDGRSLRNKYDQKCVLKSLDIGSCSNASNVWTVAKSGKALMVGHQILKILKAPASDGCAGWSAVHLGVDRGDNNTVTIDQHQGGSTVLMSTECSGRCVVMDAEGGVSLGACVATAAGGWSLQKVTGQQAEEQ